MSAPDLSLLGKRRFAPFFLVQFLGAFNDNLLKFALLYLASFTIYAGAPERAGMLATLATGLFILPFFLFSALAGQLADACDKAKIARMVKGAEVAIMALGLAGFVMQSIPLLLGVLFLMGLHSSFFGPVKFAILPQYLQSHEIMGGTGLVEAGTFLAILGGQLLAGLISPMEAGLVATGLALVGFAASLAMPPAPAIAPKLRIDPHIGRATWRILKSAGHGQGVWMAIFGISWFFAVGAMLLSAFAPLVSGTLGSRRQVATLFLLVFSVSVALGSVLVNRLLKGEVSARYVPLSAFILGGFLVDLWLATKGFVIRVPDASIGDFIDSPGGVRIIADLAGVALAGGTFIVPLYAILQTHGPPTERSRTIAANNIVNAAVSVAVVGSVSGMFALGASVPLVIGVMGMGTILLGLIFWRLLNGTKAAAQSGP